MNNKLRTLVPNNVRSIYFKLRTFGFGHSTHDSVEKLLKKINRYFFLFPSKKVEYKSEIDFLNNKTSEFSSTEIIPYPFSLNYDYKKVDVFWDESVEMFYILINNKRLYYNRSYKTSEDVQKSATYSAIEQDIDSPHRYLNKDFEIEPGDIVADLGTAEGNFALEVVEKAKALYLFETEEIWVEALKKTFEPWKEKVFIINKYVSDFDDDRNVTLENFFKNIDISAIKMDIEGAEIKVLNASKKLLGERNLKLVITTYHRQSDAKNIKNLLNELGYKTAFSKGFMLFIYDSLTPPYFRNGLIKAKKN